MPDPVWGGADEMSATGLADMVREVEGVFEERQRRLGHETTDSSRTDHTTGCPRQPGYDTEHAGNPLPLAMQPPSSSSDSRTSRRSGH
jgi:hypothetical protein